MALRRHTPEQIIAKLREAEVALAKGQSTSQVCRQLGVTEHTFYRWRVVADPLICGAVGSYDYRLNTNSPAAPAQSACGQLIGAVDVDCDDQVPAESVTWGRLKATYR